MKVALLNGFLFCAALLTAHASAVFSADSSHPQSQSSSSSQASSTFVAVHGDAVYCVEGPVCSGDAAHDPVGWSCPKKGDMAIDACMKGISSFTALGQCIAPADAECRVIPGTQTWGCMWTIEEASSTEPQAPPVTDDSVSTSSQSANSIPQSFESVTSEPPATQKLHLRVVNAAASANSESGSSDSSTTVIWIGSVAGVCAIVAIIVVAVVVFKKKHESQKQKSDQQQVVITPENMPAATPKLSKTVFVYTAQI